MRDDGSVPIHHRFGDPATSPIRTLCNDCEYLLERSVPKIYECDLGYFDFREEGDPMRPQRCIEDEEEERKSYI
jgi:hypothetical protein